MTTIAEFKRKAAETDRTLFAADFEDAGFVMAVLSDSDRPYMSKYWQDIHKWCEANFQDYTWTGDIFWFNNERDCLRFKLKWFWDIAPIMLEMYPYFVRLEWDEINYEEHRDLLDALRSRFEIDANDVFVGYKHWIGFRNPEHALYAKLILPESIFIDAVSLRLIGS